MMTTNEEARKGQHKWFTRRRCCHTTMPISQTSFNIRIKPLTQLWMVYDSHAIGHMHCILRWGGGVMKAKWMGVRRNEKKNSKWHVSKCACGRTHDTAMVHRLQIKWPNGKSWTVEQKKKAAHSSAIAIINNNVINYHCIWMLDKGRIPHHIGKGNEYRRTIVFSLWSRMDRLTSSNLCYSSCIEPRPLPQALEKGERREWKKTC